MKSTSQPLVSICIPTYNRSAYIGSALESCFAQTYKFFEIIITDNSDNNLTQQLVKKYKNKNIRYYKNKGNIGPFKNLNRAIALAKGKYIKILMDDDLLNKNCLKEMVKVMEKYDDVGIVMAPLTIVDEKGNRTYPRFYITKKMFYLYKYLDHDALVNKKDILKDFLTRIYPCCVPTGIMYRKKGFETLGMFDEKAKFAVDVEICMRFATEYNFYYLDTPLAAWRYTRESATVAFDKQGFDPHVFSYVTHKYLKNIQVRKMYSEKKFIYIRKESYFFISKRLMINAINGLKTRNLGLILSTLRQIYIQDPYKIHFLRIPLNLLKEMFSAFLYELKLMK